MRHRAITLLSGQIRMALHNTAAFNMVSKAANTEPMMRATLRAILVTSKLFFLLQGIRRRK